MNTKCYIANYAYRNKADDYKYDLFIFGSVTELCFFLNEHWNLEKKKTRNLVCTALQAGTKFDIKLSDNSVIYIEQKAVDCEVRIHGCW